MLYLPKEYKSKLKVNALSIIERDYFIEFINSLTQTKRIIFEDKVPFMEYSYTLKGGIDKNNLFYFHVSESGEINSPTCYMCRWNDCHHIHYVVTKLIEEINSHLDDDEWLNEQKAEIEEMHKLAKIREKIEKEAAKRNEQLKKVEGLLEKISKQDNIKLQKLVSIIPHILIEKSKDYQDFSLGFKIGIDKFYNIANPDKFVNCIYNNEEYSYGKYLSFKHSLENFDTPANTIINILLNRRKRNQGYYSKYTKLEIEDLENIIEAYTGKQIEISGIGKSTEPISFLVTKDEINVNFKIDSKYRIIDEGIKEGIVLDLINKSYVLVNNKIRILHFPDPKMKPLFSFIKENEKFSFELIKDVLSKEILARFYDYFEIADEIKSVIEYKEFRIEAYFDYDHDIIKLDTKYYYDDQLVDLARIKEIQYYNLKLDKYELLLRNIGVVENEIIESSKIFQFFKYDFSDLKALATVYLSERLAKIEAKTYKPMSMSLGYNVGLLSVCFNESEFTEAELYAIIKGLRKKTKYIKLKNNIILEVSESDGAALLNTIDEFNLDANSLLHQQNIPAYQALKLNDQNIKLIDYNQDDNLLYLLKDISNYKEAKYMIPDGLNDVMRSYQKEAFLWMKTLIKHNFSGVLADDMGLGKTLEMISVIISDNSISPSIIICPKSLAYNWKNEFELWAPNVKVVNIIGTPREREKIIVNISNNESIIYITSYDSLRIDIDFYEDKRFLYTILDEGQFIKNHETLKAQSVKNIKSKYRFVLTGTPIENTVMDLWSIFDFLMPGYLNNFNKFKSEYEKAIIERKDSNAVERLIFKISPFILRRIKEDVIKDLPEKTYMIQAAKMTNSQRKIYDAQLKKTKEVMQSSDNKIELLSHLTRLRQICVDPSMFLEDYNGGSGKVDLVLELIEDYINTNHKIIVFSQFTSIFPVFEKEFKKRQIDYFILTGKTSAMDRVDMASTFNVSENHKVFLVSLKAGGTGLNLIGADIVIHLDPWWNLAAENQATDRTHRIGQTKVVQVIKMVSEDSIEQKVIELQERKQEIVKMIVADDDSNIQKLSKDDLKFLLD